MGKANEYKDHQWGTTGLPASIYKDRQTVSHPAITTDKCRDKWPVSKLTSQPVNGTVSWFANQTDIMPCK